MRLRRIKLRFGLGKEAIRSSHAVETRGRVCLLDQLTKQHESIIAYYVPGWHALAWFPVQSVHRMHFALQARAALFSRQSLAVA